MSDKFAYGLVKLARTMFDWVSGYKRVDGPPDSKITLAELRKAGYLLDDKAWLEVCFHLAQFA
jgi:hypothetical protein